MKKRMILPIILIFFTIMSCKENPIIPEPVKTEPLIPLSLGNYWLYRSFELNSDGTGGTPALEKFGFMILNSPIQTTDELSSKIYLMSRCDENLIPFDDSGFKLFGGNKMVYKDNKGFYYAGVVRNDTIVSSFGDLIFAYPAEKDKSFDGHVFYYNNSGNTVSVPDELITQYICVSIDSLFSTPLGDFRCLVYKMAYLDLQPLSRAEVYFFIKPNLGIVGMVNMVFHYSSSQYTYIRKILLTDYKIYEED